MSPDFGDIWASYVSWAPFPSAREVVSLDGHVNPPCAPEPRSEDQWSSLLSIGHEIESYMQWFYSSSCQAIEACGSAFDAETHQVLAVIRNPQEHASSIGGFCFLGYDIAPDLGGFTSQSLISGSHVARRCGLRQLDMSAYCLIASLERAQGLCQDIRSLPDFRDLGVQVWAIYRRVEDSRP
jgi:hypothetical protein